jgi:hypothetical protein
MKTAEIITYEAALRRSARELRLPWRGTEKQLEARIRKFARGLSGYTLALLNDYNKPQDLPTDEWVEDR